MRSWVAPFIGLSLGLALAGLAVWWLSPSLSRMDRAQLIAMVRPAPSPQVAPAARPAVAAAPTPAPIPAAVAAPVPVAVASPAPMPRVITVPRIIPPSGPPPGRVEDLLQPPAGATSQASGTGFFVSSRGTVMTAAHVVNGCRAIRILSRHVPVAEAQLVAFDPENDIALLQAPGVDVPAQLNIGLPTRDTRSLFVLGFPQGARRDVPDETWAKLVNDSFPHSAPLETNPATLLWLQNGDIAHGYSGGPIVDPETGRVVGIVRALIDTRKAEIAYGIGMPNLSIGPGAGPLRATLGRETVRDGVVPASIGGDRALDEARRATVHVYCWL